MAAIEQNACMGVSRSVSPTFSPVITEDGGRTVIVTPADAGMWPLLKGVPGPRHRHVWTLYPSADLVADRRALSADPAGRAAGAAEQSYNVAPTHVMPIIRPAGNGRELVMAGWGLVPFWLKPDQLGKQPYSTINARADRIQTAPTYREPFKKRRCLVPASGWYEWQKIDAKTKKPHPLPAQGQALRLRWRLGRLEWRRQSGDHQLLDRDDRRGTQHGPRTTTACRWSSRRASSTTGCAARPRSRPR